MRKGNQYNFLRTDFWQTLYGKDALRKVQRPFNKLFW